MPDTLAVALPASPILPALLLFRWRQPLATTRPPSWTPFAAASPRELSWLAAASLAASPPEAGRRLVLQAATCREGNYGLGWADLPGHADGWPLDVPRAEEMLAIRYIDLWNAAVLLLRRGPEVMTPDQASRDGRRKEGAA